MNDLANITSPNPGPALQAGPVPESSLRVLLAGNPNSGKTSIFNALSGARQRVGNYPGVTVEKREGRFRDGDVEVELLDLPGTYSLSSYSPEERVAQEELLDAGADVVVVVVDSTTLKRSLVLLAQVMLLGANPVLCMNMSDEARRAGQEIDTAMLEELLGFPVVETVGHRAVGIDHLKRAIARAANTPVQRSRLVLGNLLETAIDSLASLLEDAGLATTGHRWLALKLLLGGEGTRALRGAPDLHEVGANWSMALREAETRRRAIQSRTGLDVSLYVMECYYGFVDGLLRQVVRKAPREDAREMSDRIDSVVVNRLLGIPIFLVLMYAIFWVTFTLGEYPMGWLEWGFGRLGALVGSLWPMGSDSALRSLLVDGIIGGVGGVVVFLPNILLLFLGLAFLEDSGYMARAAFLVDRLMHRFGLHGQSFIPMMTGFGCSIPGIMATRTLANERDRLTTMMVLPLMSCGARLPIYMLLIPAFFPAHLRAPALWLIYMVGIVLALVLALLLRRSFLKGEDAPFVMELPPYRMPTARAVFLKMLERSSLYLRKAGTIILAISIVMWAATSFPRLEDHQVDKDLAAGTLKIVEPIQGGEGESSSSFTGSSGLSGVPVLLDPHEYQRRRTAEELRYSLAGRIGTAIEPVIRPLGFDWKIGTAILGAFTAKEVFVAQMGIVYSLGQTDETSQELREVLTRDYSPLVGVSLMLFLLIAFPCMATFAITRRESGSWKWALLQSGGLTALGYLVALLVYQVGSLFT